MGPMLGRLTPYCRRHVSEIDEVFSRIAAHEGETFRQSAADRLHTPR